MRLFLAVGVVCSLFASSVVCAHTADAAKKRGGRSSVYRGGGKLRSLSAVDKFRIPAHRRDGARLRKLLSENFAALAPHLVEVLADCPKPRDLVAIKKGKSPYVLPSANHAGPHLISKSLMDRLVFAGSFAHQRGGYKIAVGIGRRSLHDQALLWNWRLLEKFAAFKKARPKADVKTLASMARPSGEIANPRAFGCNAPHVTGGAVDVIMLSKDDEPLVGFNRKFYYGNEKSYRKNFLLSKGDDAKYAQLLEEFMHAAGFVRYCREAWHFEAGPTALYRSWNNAGRPGRCFGAGKGGTWDPRREPQEDRIADLLRGLPKS